MTLRLLLAAFVAVFLCAQAHAANELTDIACESSATAGTGTLQLDGPLAGGYLGFAAAGITSGASVPYTIENGSQLETGWGVFTDASPDTLTRVADWSTDGEDAELTLSGTSTVCIGPIASIFDDYATLPLADATTSAKGVAELATEAETEAQTDAGRVVTPSGLVDFALLSEVFGATKVTDFTSSGTFTKDVKNITSLVIVTGAGGGGGGADTDSSGGLGAGGGEAGGTCFRWLTSTEMGASATVTIGAAGTAGVISGSGGDGGDTTFDPANAATTTPTGSGGDGGNGNFSSDDFDTRAGGRGEGGASNCDYEHAGNDGQWGGSFRDNSGAPTGQQGAGGSSYWGGGTYTALSYDFSACVSGYGPPSEAYGAGGGGAGCWDDGAGATGHAGIVGRVLVIEILDGT